MEEIALNSTRVLNALFVIVGMFLLLAFYVIYLIFCQHKKKFFGGSTFNEMLNNFYLVATWSTFIFTLTYMSLFPKYFSGAAVIAVMLLLICGYPPPFSLKPTHFNM